MDEHGYLHGHVGIREQKQPRAFVVVGDGVDDIEMPVDHGVVSLRPGHARQVDSRAGLAGIQLPQVDGKPLELSLRIPERIGRVIFIQYDMKGFMGRRHRCVR